MYPTYHDPIQRVIEDGRGHILAATRLNTLVTPIMAAPWFIIVSWQAA
jgi:hypothetical protein